MSEILEIDGSILEGGGQILRNSISLSAILGVPVRVTKIRAGRSKPGLAAQHLKGIELVAEMCQARLKGASIGSTEIEFVPGKIKGGNYLADTRTAGSVSLLLQVALPCALLADAPVHLDLRGGTNADMAPQVDYMGEVFRYMLNKFGGDFSMDVLRRGYYPKGGGHVTIDTMPVRSFRSATLTDRGSVVDIHGWSFVAGTLPIRMADQMAEGAKQKLQSLSNKINIESYKEDSSMARDNCSGIILVSELSSGCVVGSDGLGRRGAEASAVGRQAGERLADVLRSGAAVDPHTQDQLILYMALAEGKSSIRTGEVTLHTKTAIHIAEIIAKVKFTIRPDGAQNIIECTGIGFENIRDVITPNNRAIRGPIQWEPRIVPWDAFFGGSSTFQVVPPIPGRLEATRSPSQAAHGIKMDSKIDHFGLQPSSLSMDVIVSEREPTAKAFNAPSTAPNRGTDQIWSSESTSTSPTLGTDQRRSFEAMADEKSPEDSKQSSAVDAAEKIRTRLPGAARKRLKALLARNVDPERAFSLCRLPWRDIPVPKPASVAKALKRACSEESPKPQPEKNPRITVENAAAKPIFSDVAGPLRVGRDVRPVIEEQINWSSKMQQKKPQMSAETLAVKPTFSNVAGPLRVSWDVRPVTEEQMDWSSKMQHKKPQMSAETVAVKPTFSDVAGPLRVGRDVRPVTEEQINWSSKMQQKKPQMSAETVAVKPTFSDVAGPLRVSWDVRPVTEEQINWSSKMQHKKPQMSAETVAAKPAFSDVAGPLRVGIHNVRPMSEDQMDSSPKTRPKKPQMSAEKAAAKPTFSDVAGPLRVAIRDITPMSEDQMDSVHASLITAISQITDGSGPVFSGFTHKPGWILVTCEDRGSHDWLAGVLPTLLPWPGAQLTCIPAGEMPKPAVGVTFIPKSEAKTIDLALNLLKVQNRGLNTGLWKVLNSREDERGHVVTFSLDELSVERLRETGFKVNLGFKKISFKIKGESEQQTSSTSVASVSAPEARLSAPQERMVVRTPQAAIQQPNGQSSSTQSPLLPRVQRNLPTPSQGRPRPKGIGKARPFFR